MSLTNSSTSSPTHWAADESRALTLPGNPGSEEHLPLDSEPDGGRIPSHIHCGAAG